jgi:hypothetical protein
MKNIKLLFVPIILFLVAGCINAPIPDYTQVYSFDIQNNSSRGVAIRFYLMIEERVYYEKLVEVVPSGQSATVKLFRGGDGQLPKSYPYDGAISFFDVSTDLRPFHETLLI